MLSGAVVVIKDATSEEMLAHGPLPQGLSSNPGAGSLTFTSVPPLHISVYENFLRTVTYSSDGERYISYMYYCI